MDTITGGCWLSGCSFLVLREGDMERERERGIPKAVAVVFRGDHESCGKRKIMLVWKP